MSNTCESSLLDDFRRFEDLPPNSLCQFYPIPSYGNFTDFQIQCCTKINNTGWPKIGIISFYTMYISSTLDKLLCKWMKLKKYVSKPDGYQFLGLLFLQTKLFGLRNDVFDVSYQNCYYDTEPNSSSYSPIFRGRLDGALWQQIITITRHHKHPHFSRQTMNIRIPFIFFELFENRETWTLSDEAYLTEFIPNSERNRSIKKLIPTHSDRIFIISFSELYQTEKDCAKLMRKILKTPKEIQSFSHLQVQFEVAEHIECWLSRFELRTF